MNELIHYGTPRHSGRYPWGSGDRPYQRNSISKGTKSANVNDWGKDKDHNVLYITGYSGSGKSTKALELAKKHNAEVIHLDIYVEQVAKSSFKKDSNKNFNEFLKSKGYDRDEYLKIAYSKNPEIRKKRWELLDNFGDYITEYGKKRYGKSKIIVEGVQISDETLYPDKSFFIGKPFMVMKTSAIKSWLRGAIRDEKINREDLTLDDAKEYVRWYMLAYNNKNRLIKDLNLR